MKKVGLLSVICISIILACAAVAAAGEVARVDHEISNNEVSLIFNGITLDDIDDVTLDGKSIMADILDRSITEIEMTKNSFIAHFKQPLMLEGPGLIQVMLMNQEVHTSTVVVKSASCSSCAPGVYNTKKCGSITSSVGTPPYPCCDNNSNGKITDSSDGNCTWYAWYKAKKEKGWTVPDNWGSAGKWCSNAGSNSKWKVSTSPSKNTIACSSSLGHVAWVTDVSSDKKTITVKEMDCKCPTSCFASGERTAKYSASSFKYISKK